MTDLDAGMMRAIAALGIRPEAFLGRGGEAVVFAMGPERVARVHHEGADREAVSARRALLEELAPDAAALPFEIPSVLEERVVAGRVVTLERRLPGRTLREVLADARGEAREVLVRGYLEAAARIGDLQAPRPWFGDLIHPEPIRTPTFRAYLEQRASHSLAVCRTRFPGVDPAVLAQALPEPERASVVHLDAFPGNMLADGEQVTAVLDFGVVTLLGDRQLDPLTATAYLEPPITPEATASDQAHAREWLAAHGLEDGYLPARRWVAAYWSFVGAEDAKLEGWVRSVLA